jgi:ABC-type polysaccharide/polyol phosphate export permease
MTPTTEWSSDGQSEPGVVSLWRWRDLVWTLTARELALRYKGSVVGVAWSLMHPLLLALVYTVAFQLIVHVQIANYPLFLLAGLLPWLFFATTLSTAAGALADQGHLIRKVSFPRETLVAARVLAQFVHFLIAYVGVVTVYAAWQVGASPALVALPVLFGLQLAFVLGLSLIVATAQVYMRDTHHLVELLLQLWFWATPVLYALSFVPARWRPVALTNPMTLFVVAYRGVLMEHRLPSLPLLAALSCFAIAALAAGFGAYLKGRARLAENV